jgi:hypothetical protein
MSAMSMTTTPLVARVNKVSTRKSQRGMSTVRAAQMHGKGGEEGGASFGNDAFGMIAKNANYGLFASAVSKVRAGPHSVALRSNPAADTPRAETKQHTIRRGVRRDRRIVRVFFFGFEICFCNVSKKLFPDLRRVRWR